MDAVTSAGLVLAGAAGALLVGWVFRRGASSGDSGMIQQQLVELRRNIEALVSERASVPEALAEGRAQQAVSMNRQFSDLARSINDRLSSTEQTVGQRLADAGSAVADVRERLGSLAAATERLEQLGANVAEVQDLLKVPQLRGALGEVWLEELLGQIFPAQLFSIQHAFSDGERVDAVVRLGGRLVPVDAKFPLHEGERLASADGREAVRARRGFRRSVQARVAEIAEKYIRPAENTYDFALMYVPAEKVYYELLTGDKDAPPLISYALERRVIPVSPNTFYAYLMVILHGLRGMEVEDHTREILAGLEDLSSELERGIRAQEIGQRHLENAMRQQREVGDRMNSAARRVDSMVEPTTVAPGKKPNDPAARLA